MEGRNNEKEGGEGAPRPPPNRPRIGSIKSHQDPTGREPENLNDSASHFNHFSFLQKPESVDALEKCSKFFFSPLVKDQDRSLHNYSPGRSNVNEVMSFCISLKKCQSEVSSPLKKGALAMLDFEPKMQTSLKKFAKLFFLCFKLFVGQRIFTEDLILSPQEETIFNLILERKFFRRKKSPEFFQEFSVSVENINLLLAKNNLKRPEECYKFIFTRVLKYLKKRFKSTYNIKRSLDENFYKYYFHQTACFSDTRIESFYYPIGNKSSQDGSGEKKMSLNADYFRLVFKSSLFVRHFKEFTSTILLEECREDIITKLEGIFLKWERQIEKHGEQKTLSEINTYLMKNKHSKLPWTLNEIKKSIEKLNEFAGLSEQSNESRKF